MVVPESKLFINGKWKASAAQEEIRNPYNHEVVGTVSVGTAQEMNEAIESATRAFQNTRYLPTYERVNVLTKISSLLKQKSEEFAHLMTLESGKPIQYTRGEVERGIFTFRLAAEEASRIEGQVLPLDLSSQSKNRSGIYKRFPIGPIAAFSPFNFPLNLIAHKLAPALASGNTMILKPPPQCPFTGLALARLVEEAGVLPGQVNVLHCPVNVAEVMVRDDRVKMLNFTGSPNVGWYLKSIAGKKKILLELGGNAAVIVDKEVDLEKILKRLSIGAFANAGQICIKVQRIYVHQDFYQKFEEQFCREATQLKLGNPLDENTVVGPMINLENAQRAETWIQESKKAGAQVLVGGKRNGNFIEPTVISNAKPGMKVLDEEVFAPVVTLDPFNSFNDACEKVNASRYGLQAGVFTNSLQNAFYAFERLDVGGVVVNDFATYRIDHMTYGGIKESGFGREGVRFAIQEMTEPKLMVLNL